MKFIIVSFVMAVSVLFCGCVSGSKVVTGQVRAAVQPFNVKVYTAMPEGAEVIGIVTANSTASLSWDKAKVQCIEKLRGKAGELGANGIVITDVNDSVWEGQKMQAQAIYLPPK